LRFYREREKAGEDLERKVEVSRDSKGERERERENEKKNNNNNYRSGCSIPLSWREVT
jgi:hypothetical protein